MTNRLGRVIDRARVLAERLEGASPGFDSLWVIERILWQSSPRSPIRSAMALCLSR